MSSPIEETMATLHDVVKSGKVVAEPNMFLTRREIQRGVALACQTYIKGDVVVEVPIESRVGGVPQLATEDAVRFGKVSQWVGEDAPKVVVLSHESGPIGQRGQPRQHARTPSSFTSNSQFLSLAGHVG